MPNEKVPGWNIKSEEANELLKSKQANSKLKFYPKVRLTIKSNIIKKKKNSSSPNINFKSTNVNKSKLVEDNQSKSILRKFKSARSPQALSSPKSSIADSEPSSFSQDLSFHSDKSVDMSQTSTEFSQYASLDSNNLTIGFSDIYSTISSGYHYKIEPTSSIPSRTQVTRANNFPSLRKVLEKKGHQEDFKLFKK